MNEIMMIVKKDISNTLKKPDQIVRYVQKLESGCDQMHENACTRGTFIAARPQGRKSLSVLIVY